MKGARNFLKHFYLVKMNHLDCAGECEQSECSDVVNNHSQDFKKFDNMNDVLIDEVLAMENS